MTQALVPLKDLVQAKTRLAGLLSPSERRALAQVMLEDVLTVLASHPDISGVTLVSSDPSAHMLATQYGARHWPETEMACRGLNAVAARASERLLADGGEPLLLVHADLPMLTAADVSAVLAARESAGLVVGCDRHGKGTNLLCFDAGSMPPFCFGADSCARHVAAARSHGIAVTVLERAGIGLDVDEPADLESLLSQLAGKDDSHTATLMHSTGLGARIGLALASLSPARYSTRQARGTLMFNWQQIQADLLAGASLTQEQARALADYPDTAALAAVAGPLRDRGFRNVITYSRKVFIPLTQLCRDVCHYCTFAQTPKKIGQPFMSVEQVLDICHQGARQGCQEALFTLGEKPELRYNAARRALEELGFADTLSYLRHVASRVLEETGLLPHINAGCMTAAEIAGLRTVSASMGIMLESASPRLCEKGMPHYGSPDKDPAVRLQTLELAGQAAVPFTSGILIGIGETRLERIESLLALRAVHERHGHLQEVIVQNFRAKPGTLMASAPEPDLDDLLWTIAVARLVFGRDMSIQAPPNLSPGVLPQLVAAGINDWGGVSPLTPDHVNPEAPWPHLDQLARETLSAGKYLDQRLTIYPAYASDAERWLDPAVRPAVLRHSDAEGFARRDNWVPGQEQAIPDTDARLLHGDPADAAVADDLRGIFERCRAGGELEEADIARLFQVRGAEFAWVVRRADELRQQVNGNVVSYIVNRNINYTNVCYFKCQFCAFSKGKHNEELRGRPYDISGEEIAGRCIEAWTRGATEVCMQGGIHPDYTGQTYLDILHTVRAATPGMHVHAFSPLEVYQGATTLGIDIETFLRRLKEAGLNTLPGTAAEVLHDDVRRVLCPDKLDTAQWLEVIEAAHRVGLRTTATIMYGHIDQPHHWARHLWHIRELQRRSGGFTEFVPLPFVHMEAPMYLRGRARRGPTFREAVLMHAVARLTLHGLIDNIQASWVKMGEQGVAACLDAGVNDLGGTLMNESITRAAGSGHGQEWAPAFMEQQIIAAGRQPCMRTTLYQQVSPERRAAAFSALPLAEVHNAGAGKRERSKRLVPVVAVPLDFQDELQDMGHLVYQQVMLMAACN